MKFIQDISILMAIVYIIWHYNTMYLQRYISLAVHTHSLCKVLPSTSTLQEKTQTKTEIETETVFILCYFFREYLN